MLSAVNIFHAGTKLRASLAYPWTEEYGKKKKKKKQAED